MFVIRFIFKVSSVNQLFVLFLRKLFEGNKFCGYGEIKC